MRLTMIFPVFLVAVLSVVLLSACNVATENAQGSAQSNQVKQSNSTAELGNARWRLSTIDGQPAVGDAWLEFDLTAGTLAGSGGCNRLVGSVADKAGQLSMQRVGATKRMCTEPTGVSAQERTLITCLNSLTASSLSADRLVLDGGGHKLELVRVTPSSSKVGGK